jgi:hypothetical protein
MIFSDPVGVFRIGHSTLVVVARLCGANKTKGRPSLASPLDRFQFFCRVNDKRAENWVFEDPPVWLGETGGNSFCPHRLFGGLLHRYNGNEGATASRGKLDIAVTERKQGMVFAHADVCPRMPGGTMLTHNDIAGDDVLVAVFFYAEALTV